MKQKHEKRRGRPPRHGDALLGPITLRLPEPMMAEIDRLMGVRLDAPDKSAVIRELIAAGLQRMKKSQT